MNQAKLTGTLIATVAILLLALQNRALVRTHFLVFSVDMPQIVLLLIVAGLGFILGLTVAAKSGSKGKAAGGYQGR